MLLATQIIRRPLVTEKNTTAAEVNRYAFEVDRRATKPEVKSAVEELYRVRVVSVAMLRRSGKARRTRFGEIQMPETKRAIVKVHAEDRIELF